LKLFSAFALCGLSTWAAAIYSTSVTSDFMIGGATVFKGPEVPVTLFTPGAFSTATGLVSADGILPAIRGIAVAGIAPVSVTSATSTYQSSHLIHIDNSTGLAPLLAAFTFGYSWDIVLGVTSSPADRATGGAFFHITGIDNEILIVEGAPVAEFLLNPTYDTLTGSTGGTGTGMIGGGIIVPAGEVSLFSVITDTNGFAISTPEPATLGLALTALGFLAVRRRVRY